MDVQIFVESHIEAEGVEGSQTKVEQDNYEHLSRETESKNFCIHHPVGQHHSSNQKVARAVRPVNSADEVNVEETLQAADEVEEEIGADVGVAKALVEESRMQVEVSHALVAGFAVLCVHRFLSQAI